MDRARKQELVTSLNGVFADAGVIVVSHYKGLTVSEMTDLRRQMAEAGATLKGTPANGISDLFVGPTVIAYSEDPVAAPRIAAKFAKSNEKLVLLGGVMGETMLDVDGVKALAALPSLDELRGKIVGLVNAPATKVAGVLQAPAGQLARVMGAYASKSEAA